MALAKGAIPKELLDKIGGEVGKMNADAEDAPAQQETPPAQLSDADREEKIESLLDAMESAEDDIGEAKPYKSKEEFEAEGRDPEFFMGKKAYEQQQSLLQQIKALKEKAKSKDADIEALTEGIEEIREKLRKDQQKEILAERTYWLKKMEEAKREMLPEQYAAARDKFSAADSEAKKIYQEAAQQQQEQAGEPYVIQEMRKNIPMLDKESPSYSKAYDRAVSLEYNEMLSEFVQRNQRAMTDVEIVKHLKEAIRSVNKSLNINSMRETANAPPPAPAAARGRSAKPSSDMPPAHKALVDKWEKEGKKTGNKQLLAQAKKLRANYEK